MEEIEAIEIKNKTIEIINNPLFPKKLEEIGV